MTDLDELHSAKSPALKKKLVAAVIGGGPAGLMAAETLSNAGLQVDVYEAMPTLGRKFLRAGIGGLNITHNEAFEKFCTRYGERQSELQASLDAFNPQDLRQWVQGLGIETFVGTSGRVFPKEMKAAPLLRAWLQRLRASGVVFHLGHRWGGFRDDGYLQMIRGEEQILVKPDAVVLALGGASWPQLGSTGAWVTCLQESGVEIVPWRSANCGFDFPWTAHMREKFAGAPLKAIAIEFCGEDGVREKRRGELLVSDYGLEGSLIYAFSRSLRDTIEKNGEATILIDLLPDRSTDRVAKDLSRSQQSHSLSRQLQSCFGKDPLRRALLYELLDREQLRQPSILAQLIKALPLPLRSWRPIEEAISSAGGVSFGSLDQNLMLRARPGIFVAGEMLDWEAPTGGYLLTACFATGRQAARGLIDWLKSESSSV